MKLCECKNANAQNCYLKSNGGCPKPAVKVSKGGVALLTGARADTFGVDLLGVVLSQHKGGPGENCFIRNGRKKINVPQVGTMQSILTV